MQKLDNAHKAKTYKVYKSTKKTLYKKVGWPCMPAILAFITPQTQARVVKIIYQSVRKATLRGFRCFTECKTSSDKCLDFNFM